jgi:hypothetical protein
VTHWASATTARKWDNAVCRVGHGLLPRRVPLSPPVVLHQEFLPPTPSTAACMGARCHPGWGFLTTAAQIPCERGGGAHGVSVSLGGTLAHLFPGLRPPWWRGTPLSCGLASTCRCPVSLCPRRYTVVLHGGFALVPWP